MTLAAVILKVQIIAVRYFYFSSYPEASMGRLPVFPVYALGTGQFHAPDRDC